MKGEQSRLTDDQLDEAAKRYRSLETIGQIVVAMKVGRASIRNGLKQRGVKMHIGGSSR